MTINFSGINEFFIAFLGVWAITKEIPNTKTKLNIKRIWFMAFLF
jgi:hypothetical protein